MDAYVLDDWYEELNDVDHKIYAVEDLPLEDVFMPPTPFVAEASVLVTVAPDYGSGDAPVLFGTEGLGDEQEYTYQVPICSYEHDDSYTLDIDE